MAAGIKYNQEVPMKARIINQTKRTTVKMNVRVNLKLGFIVALVASGLWATPSA